MIESTEPTQVVLHTRVVTGAGGGPDKTILNSPRYLTAHGYRVRCAYMHPPADPGFAELQRRAEELDAGLLSIPDRGPWDLSVPRELLDICRRERVTIWHGHDYKSNALGVLLRRFWPMRLVTTVHGWVNYTWRTPLYYWIDHGSLRFYEKVICVSSDLAAECVASGVADDKCVLIENAIDTTQFTRSMSSEVAKSLAGISPARFVVGAAGRLAPEKGFDLLIRAVHQVIQEGCNVQLLIAGEGTQRVALQTLVRDLGLDGYVQLLGYQKDLTTFYQALDAFALSSLREGLPNVLLEALAFEVPILATRVAGIPRLIREGDTGLLVEPGDVQGIVRQLKRLIAEPELRHACGARGRAMIEQNYTFARRMEKVRSVYESLVGSPTAAEVADSSRKR